MNMSITTTNEHDTKAVDALRNVYDPETGLNMIDLGLIYDVAFDKEHSRYDVVMTLTTPACPMGEAMTEGVRRALEALPGVSSANVSVTFYPPWTPERITPEGREQLGWG